MVRTGVFLWCLVALLLSPSVQAETIIDTGEVHYLQSPEDEFYMAMGATRFEVSGGTVTLDVLGRGFTAGPNRRGLEDPFLYLFSDDGNVGLDDFLAQNDDSPLTFGDGSRHRYDSFLEMSLAKGNYVAFVGRYVPGSYISSTSNDVYAQFVPEGFLHFSGTDPKAGAVLHPDRVIEDYRLTITGDGVRFSDRFGGGGPAAIPLPVSSVLLGSALAGLAVLGRLRRNARRTLLASGGSPRQAAARFLGGAANVSDNEPVQGEARLGREL